MGHEGRGLLSAALPTPFDEPAEHTSHYGPLFWSGVAIGGACMAFGMVALMSKAAATAPSNFAVYFVGLALLHDLLIVPIVMVIAVALRRVTPRAGRGLVSGALLVSATVVLFSVPFVAGWGAQPDNPSFLPRDYRLGMAVVLAAVWAISIVLLIRRHRRTP
jgi:hypothetical protein